MDTEVRWVMWKCENLQPKSSSAYNLAEVGIPHNNQLQTVVV